MPPDLGFSALNCHRVQDKKHSMQPAVAGAMLVAPLWE